MKNIFYSLIIITGLYNYTFGQLVPVAYYPFGGNANDAGSNALNGVLYGNPSLTTDLHGIANSAYEFDGIDDYINLGSSVLLKPNSQVTLALWAYSSNWVSFTSWAALAGNTASGGYELIIHGSSGTIEAECKRNGSYAIADYPLSNLSNGWHHLAFTFDGRYTILYVDGIAVDNDDAGAVYPIQYGYPGNSTIIGDEAGTGNVPEGDSFTGKIDEVYFFDVALNAQEIQNIYSNYLNINEEQSHLNNYTAYPNPASDEIIINVPEIIEAYNITLTDLSGRIIIKKDISSADNKIIFYKPVNVNAGIYLLNIKHKNGFNLSYKVVFQ